MPAPELENGIHLNVANIKEMIQQVAFAASTDEARPILTGVLLTLEDNQITLSAADGFRLSIRKDQLSAPVSRPVRAVIPARALTELARVATDGEGEVIMLLPPGRGQVVFHMPDVELVSQLIEGTFPELSQLIPQKYNTRSVMPTSAFLKACKQAEIFAREGSHIARINVTTNGDMQPGMVEITGQSEETGFNQTTVDATVEGGNQLIAFNVRFLREVLDVIPTPNVALETTADQNPGVIRPVGEDNFIHVIMPMHLGS